MTVDELIPVLVGFSLNGGGKAEICTKSTEGLHSQFYSIEIKQDSEKQYVLFEFFIDDSKSFYDRFILRNEKMWGEL